MKIEIEVKDISLLVKALNNACISYGDIVWGIYIGCEVLSKFDPLKKLPQEELKARMDCLKDVYKQVENIERAMEDSNYG